MTTVSDFITKLASHSGRDAMVWNDGTFRFADILARAAGCKQQFIGAGLGLGSVVAIEADYSPGAVAAFLAALELGAVVVPLTSSVERSKPEFCETAEVEWHVRFNQADQSTVSSSGRQASHPLIKQLRTSGHPGLILFSSGSTGRSKAIVHDMELLVRKYLKPRYCYRTLAFLLFDHIGGIDTLLYNLANGSCLVTVPDHSPESVCSAVAAHRVEVLPVSPTFLNLLMLSGACQRYDLSSLQIITYGAEIMPETTLTRLHQALPHLKLIQKFGASEIGTLRSQSRSSDSVWVKIGGEGYQTRVIDGLLEIKADSAMLGYLNAPSPFTADGWFKTGDAVLVDGEWMRILGRKSDLINVGGEKVYPSEVENVLLQMDGVEEAAVFGESNVITGNIVVAKVKLLTDETSSTFRKRMVEYCRSLLPQYKIPQKVVLFGHSLTNARFKKMRRGAVGQID